MEEEKKHRARRNVPSTVETSGTNEVIPVPTEVEITEEQLRKIQSSDELKEFLPLFNLNIVKKQALRVVKREEILDMTTDRIKERLSVCSDEMTTKDLLDCDKVMSEQKQRELDRINSISESPSITLNQQNNTVNVSINDSVSLSKDSRDRVVDVVKELLKKVSSDSENK